MVEQISIQAVNNNTSAELTRSTNLILINETPVKAEGLKQFDGDYDILYKHAKNISIKEPSLESILSGDMPEKISRSTGFENIIANVPNFQISVPVHCKKWDDLNYTPLVANAPTGVDEKDLKQIKAYDSAEKVHSFDARAEPDKPIIVVGVSEPVDENGKLKYAFESHYVAAASRVNGQNIRLASMKFLSG